MKKKFTVRTIVQIFFFALIAVISIAEIASLHALCPFGGVVTLYSLFAQGTLVHKIQMSSLILMGLVFILSILFGPVFCGWVCPFGSIQEWIGKIGKKIFPKIFNRFIPVKADKVLRYLRLFVLAWVVYVTAKSGTLLFSNIDPYFALFRFWTEEAALPSLIILAITLISSLFVARPWCRYFCPYGALLGLFNKVRVFKVTRNAGTCINCKKCDNACPMRINVSDKKKVSDLQCISCYECTSERSCPVKNTVNMQTCKTKCDGGAQHEN